jgi:beta-mannosidase
MHLIKSLIALLLFSSAALASAAETQNTVSLNGDWQLSYWQQPAEAVTSPADMNKVNVKTIPAKVPGNVEIDLLAAGLIKDPMIGDNVNDLRQWEGYQWCYTKEFTAPTVGEGQTLQLYFGGIDCLADIWLNGEHIGKAENMLIEHTFDITKQVKQGGTNKLQVILRSVVLEAQKHLLGQSSIGNFASDESVYTRKAPSMYGWDIMPRLVSAGLWRSVEVRVLQPTRFRDVNYATYNVDTAGHKAWCNADAQIQMPFNKFDKVKAQLTLSRNGKVAYTGSTIVNTPTVRFNVYVENADLWWPRGYGEPALYDAKMELIDSDGTVLATDTKKIGLRTVKLKMDPVNLPEKRGDFSFIVNGERIFIHGSNWVPLDALHSRDASHYDKMIAMATDINCNMVRCWGGNVYEDTRLFDLCDANGILVWQDFVMGCSFYPQRDDFAKAIEEEVTSVVLKLRNHPSLALWAGNNEDDYCFRSLSPYGFDPNKDVISRKVIPQVLYEFDLTRPYIPSSPYFTEEVCQHGGGDDVLPENHLWGPRGYYKDSFYKSQQCTFVSEMGYHGCPNVESLQKMMTKDCVYPWTSGFNWNDEWVTKSVRRFPSWGKTYDRNNLMINQIKMLFGDVPTKLEDFSFASQSVQAEAMKYFLEMLRGEKFDKRTGMIWWNLRDGWPIISDAIVDYYYSKKMAYYFLRNAEKDVCVFINDPADGGDGSYQLMAVNDTRNAAKGEVTVTDVETGHKVYSGNFDVPANGKVKIAPIAAMKGQGILLISYKVGDKQLGNHYLYGNPPFKLDNYKSLLKKTKLFEIK